MKRCEHDWQPIFREPTKANTQALRIDAMFVLRYNAAGAYACTLCGCHGAKSRGYSRGGGHKMIVLRDGYSADFLAEAEAWNKRVETELKEAAQDAVGTGFTL